MHETIISGGIPMSHHASCPMQMLPGYLESFFPRRVFRNAEVNPQSSGIIRMRLGADCCRIKRLSGLWEAFIAYCWYQRRTVWGMPCLRLTRKGQNRIPDQAAGSSMGMPGAVCERHRPWGTVRRSADHQKNQSSRARGGTSSAVRRYMTDQGRGLALGYREGRPDPP